MAESRAADFIAYGMNRGVDRMFEGLERRKEEEKREAKEFKSLVEFAESSGMLSKDQAMVMDRDSLKGFVRGKMHREEQDRLNSTAVLEQFSKLQKLKEAQAMTGFTTDFHSEMARSPNLADYYENPEAYQGQAPTGDVLSAFQHASSRNPNVPPADLNAFMGSLDKAIPAAAKTYAPTDDFRMLQEITQLRASGKDADADKLEAILQKRAAPSGMSVRMNPDGSWEMTQGSVNGPTMGFKTDAQKIEANAAATFATIDHILANQKASDWGIRGLLGKVQDEWIAQALPAAADPRRIDVQAAVSQLRQQMMAVLKAESQLSQKDKEEIMASLPKTGAGESPQSALQKIARSKELMSERVKAYSKQTGKPPPLYALKPEEMTLEQIGQAKEQGVLSEMQAIDAILKYHSDKLPK